MLARVTSTVRLRESDLKELGNLSSFFTVRDCLSILSSADRQLSSHQSMWMELTASTVDRLVSLSQQPSFGALGTVIMSLSRLRSNRAHYYLHAVMGSMSHESIKACTLGERVSLLHVLTKKSYKVEFLDDVLLQCIEDHEEWDHMSGSLLVAVASRVPKAPPGVQNAIDSFCIRQKDRLGEWSAQSISIFVLSISKLVKPTCSDPIKSFTSDLVSAANLSDFTDQNICNLIVGLSNLNCSVPERLLAESSTRKMKNQDLVFLLKSRDPKIAEFALSHLPRTISPTEAIAVCDVGSVNHGELIARYVDVNNLGDIEAAFYVMNKLNHRPTSLKSFTVPDSLSGHKASQILSAMCKLDIRDLSTVRSLVHRVLHDTAKSSDLAKSVFSVTCLILDEEERIGIVLDLLTRIRLSELNMIDKRQLMRAACVLFQTSQDMNANVIDVIISLHALSADVCPEKVPAPSRAQLQVKGTLNRIISDKTHAVLEEVLVPSISSYIDILVSHR